MDSLHFGLPLRSTLRILCSAVREVSYRHDLNGYFQIGSSIIDRDARFVCKGPLSILPGR